MCSRPQCRHRESSALAARSNDTYLTGKVKAGFLSVDRFSPNDVKVVTEAGVVCLMGLVTRKGLPVPPGEPAINPAPRKLIADTIAGLGSMDFVLGDTDR